MGHGGGTRVRGTHGARQGICGSHASGVSPVTRGDHCTRVVGWLLRWWWVQVVGWHGGMCGWPWCGVTRGCVQVVVRPAGWRWRGTGARSTHGKEEGAAVVQAVGARLRGLREEDSVLLEALVPTARLPAPPPRKAPAFGCPPPWDGREGPPEAPPGPCGCGGHTSIP